MATSLKELVVTFQANSGPVLNALNKIDSRLKTTANTLRSTGESFSRLGREIGLTLSLPIAAMGLASVKAASDIESLEASLTSVLTKFKTDGTIEEAISSEMNFLKETATQLGVSLQSIQKPYVQYLASSKDSLEVTRKTIKSFLGLSTALGLPAAQTKLIIKALQQMQSKGTVMAEELRLQLGDSVPGAVDLFAEAMGVGTKEFLKMMEQGKISSKVLKDVSEVIEKKYGAAIEKGSKTIRASTNRISNAFFLLRVNVGRGLDETFKVNEKMTKFANWLTKVGDNFARLDDKGKKILLTIGLVIGVLGPFLLALGAVVKLLSISVAGLALFLKPFKWLLIFLPKIGRSMLLFARLNPLGAFITATLLIIEYWGEIVGLFKKAGSFIGKFIPGVAEVSEKQKERNFSPTDYKPMLKGVGSGINSMVGGANNFLAERNMLPGSFLSGGSRNSPMSNQRTSNNTLVVNIPPGMSSVDAPDIKNAVRQAIQEENRQSYIELGVQ